MTDRTPEQANSALDRAENILADLTLRLDRLERTVEIFAQTVAESVATTNRRLLSLETSREEHEETIKRLDTLITGHDVRMRQLEENGQDLKPILQTLTRRFSGESDATQTGQ
jgi:chromosome segregation ATPase